MSSIVYPFGKATITVPANEKVAIYSRNQFTLSKLVAYPQIPNAVTIVTSDSDGGVYTSAVLNASAATTAYIEAGPEPVYYEIGVTPVVKQVVQAQYQADPVAVNTTGAVSALAIMGGIVTSSTAAAVAGTIPTGTVMDASSEFAVGDSVDWSVINTGPNTFTVTAATDHTIVGTATVATATSCQFRTRKTADNTFVTYRIG